VDDSLHEQEIDWTGVMKIFCAIPNLGEIATGNVWNLLHWKSDPTLDIEVYLPEGVVPGSRARNVIHQAFLQSDCDALFMLDERTVPQTAYLDKLCYHLRTKDIVSACVQTIQLDAAKQPHLVPLGFRWHDDVGGYLHENSIGLTEIHTGSISCCLVRREVMERVERPAFQTVYDGEFGEEGMTCDFDFCEKVRAAGYRLWMDYDMLCRHYQRLETKNINAMLNRVNWAAKR